MDKGNGSCANCITLYGFFFSLKRHVTETGILCPNLFKLLKEREREKSGKIYWLQLHCTYSSYTFNFCIVSCDEHIYLYFGNVGKLFSCLPMLILVKFFFAALLCCCFLSFSLVNKTLDAIVVHCNERLLQLNLCIWKCCTIEIS